MSRNLKAAAAAVIAAGILVSPVAWAASTDSSADASKTTEATPSKGDSEFEKTRQHMMEKNKESQRTGKM